MQTFAKPKFDVVKCLEIEASTTPEEIIDFILINSGQKFLSITRSNHIVGNPVFIEFSTKESASLMNGSILFTYSGCLYYVEAEFASIFKEFYMIV